MNEGSEKYRLPNIIAPGLEPPSRKGPKTFAGAGDICAQPKDFDYILKHIQIREGDGAPGQVPERVFKSRFHPWLRAVALVVVLVFVPEQASWAFNYNPLVLWGNKAGTRGQGLGVRGQESTSDQRPATSDPDPLLRSGRDSDRADSERRSEIISARIAASIQHLLDKIAYKEKTRIQLQLSPDPRFDDEMAERSLRS